MHPFGYPFHSAVAADSGFVGLSPLDRADASRPAAGRGGRGLRGGEGARPTRLCWIHLAASRGYPLAPEYQRDRYRAATVMERFPSEIRRLSTPCDALPPGKRRRRYCRISEGTCSALRLQVWVW